jgi:hypothetical protein
MGNFMAAANLELAISAIRSGRKGEGRQLLNLLIQQNPNDDKAWLWMSSVVDTDEQRARCLYHVLAIDPNSDLARRGLEILGIVLSDSRPVKIPRDSQPIQIPRPTMPQMQGNPGQERRPFLIDPQTIASELPFTPMVAMVMEPIQASPAILAIDVEGASSAVGDEEDDAGQAAHPSEPVPTAGAAGLQEAPPSVVPGQAGALPNPSNPVTPVSSTDEVADVVTQPLPEHQAMILQSAAFAASAAQEVDTRPLPSEAAPVVASTETEQLPQYPASTGQLQNPSEPVPVVQANTQAGLPSQPQNWPGQGAQAQPAAFTGQPGATGNMPVNQTRPSQPVPVTHPAQNQLPYNAGTPAYPNHADATMGMPMYQPPQNPAQPMLPPHAAATMGMPMAAPNGQFQHPSEPVPVVHTNNTLGTVPMGQIQGMAPGFHSTATTMMPAMSEAEARARLMSGVAIPSATATAMTLQNAANQVGMAGNPALHGYPYAAGGDEEGVEDDDSINIMAVIIFGTLSITALGGLGMLILLIFTAPAG